MRPSALTNEIPDLDAGLCQQALLDTRVDLVHTTRPIRAWASEIAERLELAREPLQFNHQGEYQRLQVGVRRALRGAGLGRAQVRALVSEIQHLVRFFTGVSAEVHPRVELVFGDALDRPRAGAALTLVSAVLGRARVELDVGEAQPLCLPPRSVVTCRGDSTRLRVSSQAAAARPDLWLIVSTERAPHYLAAPTTSTRSGSDAIFAAPAERRDVVLVSMPFGPLNQASLGLSLLAATLEGVTSEILYFMLAFAEQISPSAYAWIADSRPADEALAGEWIFSAALFGERPEADAGYRREVLAKVPECEIEDLLRARAKVEPFLDDCVAAIVARQPKIVGFTSVFNQHVASLALAKRLERALPGVTILFGGANCESVMGLEAARRFEFIDAVVSGEGEQVFSQIIHSVLAGRGVPNLPGVYTRRNALLSVGKPANAPLTTDLDTLPRPDFQGFFRQWEAVPALANYAPRVMFETSRGCWWGAKHHCTFCGLNGQTMAFRSKSGARALDELMALIDAHPECAVAVVDNILDMKYFKTLVPELAKQEHPRLQLFYETKANLRKQQLQALREAGIVFIQPGIESFSDETLRIMQKGVSTLQNIQLLKWSLEVGVWPFWNVLWGFPGERPEEHDQIAKMLPSLYHLPPPQAFARLRLDRFSPNFEDADALGFADVRPVPAYGYIYALPPEALANIAYYFHYGYQDGRDPSTYTKSLLEALYTWQEAFESSHLVYIDKGQDLIIWDTRPVATQQMSVVSGVARDLYLACDQATSLSALRGALERSTGRAYEIQELEQIARPLLDANIMLQVKQQLLSLALPHQAALAPRDYLRAPM